MGYALDAAAGAQTDDVVLWPQLTSFIALKSGTSRLYGDVDHRLFVLPNRLVQHVFRMSLFSQPAK